MIPYLTRFNPTANGYLHLGHLYNILVNRAAGTKFTVRFDDTQRYWNWLHSPAEIATYKEQMRSDIQWLNIEVDGWYSQAEMMPEVDRFIDEICWPVHEQPFCAFFAAEVIGSHVPVYPFTERLTAEKVVFDCFQAVEMGMFSWIIRGLDLLPEDNLYRYFVDKFELTQPRMTYIPRLEFAGDVVSKTAGNYKIKDYRAAGIDPVEDLIPRLALDCLIDSFGSWMPDNIKPQPVLGKWAKEMLHG